MKILKKYYPFWLGLILCVGLIGIFHETMSFAVLFAYIMGYFRITDFNS